MLIIHRDPKKGRKKCRAVKGAGSAPPVRRIRLWPLRKTFPAGPPTPPTSRCDIRHGAYRSAPHPAASAATGKPVRCPAWRVSLRRYPIPCCTWQHDPDRVSWLPRGESLPPNRGRKLGKPASPANVAEGVVRVQTLAVSAKLCIVASVRWCHASGTEQTWRENSGG